MREPTRFNRLIVSLGLALVATAWIGSSSAQQAPPAPGAVLVPPLVEVRSPRLYVLDCGTLIYNLPESYNLKREEVASTNMSVACYLVVHPRGLLLYDTGLSDTIVGRPIYENPIGAYGQLKFRTLRGQLADLGVLPSQVTHLALSHGHVDHIGNANDYATATWLTPKAERDFMFSPEIKSRYYFAQYAALEHSKTITFDGDHDVFGDGTVVLKATPGHTPGHQSLYVKLANTGGVLLSGDLYHYAEERTLDRMPEREKTSATPVSRAAMEDFLRQTKSQLWIGHDIGLFQRSVKAPGWYD